MQVKRKWSFQRAVKNASLFLSSCILHLLYKLSIALSSRVAVVYFHFSFVLRSELLPVENLRYDVGVTYAQLRNIVEFPGREHVRRETLITEQKLIPTQCPRQRKPRARTSSLRRLVSIFTVKLAELIGAV